MKPSRTRSIAILAAATLLLAACGSGGDDNHDGGGGPSIPIPSFIAWQGNANGEVVLDADGEPFKVTQEPSCVWDDARKLLIVNWCHRPGDPSYKLLFVDYFVHVTAHRMPDGRCVGVFSDPQTGLRVDIRKVGDVMTFVRGAEYVRPC